MNYPHSKALPNTRNAQKAYNHIYKLLTHDGTGSSKAMEIVGAVAIHMYEHPELWKPNQLAYLVGLPDGLNSLARDDDPDFTFTRAFPEGPVIAGDGTAIAFLWVLKNAGYGHSMTEVLHGSDVTYIKAKPGTAWVWEDLQSLVTDQWQIALASCRNELNLPWKRLFDESDRFLNNSRGYYGYYRKHTNGLLYDSAARLSDFQETLHMSHHLSAVELMHRFGRIDQYVYRTANSNTIPSFLNNLAADHVFLPSLLRNVNLTSAFLHSGVPTIFRNIRGWETLIQQTSASSSSERVAKSRVFKFKHQQATLSPGSVEPYNWGAANRN